MTERIALAEPPPPVRAPSALRSLAVIGVTAFTMLLAELVVSQVTVVGMFMPVYLLGIPIVIVLLALAVMAIAKGLTGRARPLAAFMVSLLLASIGAFGFVTGRLVPVMLDPNGWVHILICVLCALTLGLSLGPLPLRLAAAAATLAAIVLVVVLPTSAERAAEEGAAALAEQEQEERDYFLEEGTFAVVTDLPGWSNSRVQLSGATWLVTDDGAVAFALVQGHAVESQVTGACSFLGRQGDSNDIGADGNPIWCIRTDTGWARADGTGIAYVEDGLFIAVNAADEYKVEEVGGTGPAAPEQIAQLQGNLREMTMDEVHTYIGDAYQGSDTPPLDTPGL